MAQLPSRPSRKQSPESREKRSFERGVGRDEHEMRRLVPRRTWIEAVAGARVSPARLGFLSFRPQPRALWRQLDSGPGEQDELRRHLQHGRRGNTAARGTADFEAGGT